MGVFRGVTLTLALSHDGRGDFHALICSMILRTQDTRLWDGCGGSRGRGG